MKILIQQYEFTLFISHCLQLNDWLDLSWWFWTSNNVIATKGIKKFAAVGSRVLFMFIEKFMDLDFNPCCYQNIITWFLGLNPSIQKCCQNPFMTNRQTASTFFGRGKKLTYLHVVVSVYMWYVDCCSCCRKNCLAIVSHRQTSSS